MFSSVRTGSMNFSLFPALNKIIVNGTNMIRETSLVTNMDVKNTLKTKKNVSAIIEPSLLVFRRSGENMFSFLKPSSVLRSMKSVARVFQSIDERRFFDGGVMNNDAIAAMRATESMSSFLKNASVFAAKFFILKY